MRYSGFIAAAAALALGLASLPADAASERHRGASARDATSSDNMADDLNSRSLSRAQAGQDAMSGSSGGSMMGSGSGSMGMSGGQMGGSGYGAGRGGMSGSSMGGPGMSGGGGTGSSGPVGTGGGMR